MQAGERVLELGFGGGIGLQMLLAEGAVVTGVEPAIAMRAGALRQHASQIASGRLEIVDGSAEHLPDGPFAAAISMNTAYFWNDMPGAMAELRRTCGRGVVNRVH